ncbi:MAG TPA: tetraacyldisaccharide 4'-kinase [Chitinophagaceae bacterium]|nr:tetraacyldisaccharide 4'-kinase [Chitinophagaceae bacterium]
MISTNNINKVLRLLLFPFSLVYGIITWIRNRLYDKGVLTEIEFDIPTIAVGNLSVGGTGKTPHVEYLIRLLREQFYVATLSRGYNRNTNGYLFADEHATALSIGDEPMQFYRNFPDIAVGVGERRGLALPQLLMDAPDTEVVLLDDAFQHRSIKPGLNIMITEYQRLFTRDHIVPFGRLRESREGYARADCIIVSKCPRTISGREKQKIRREINPLTHQKLFFTTLGYGRCYNFMTGEPEHILPHSGIIAACGIANPQPFLEYLLTKTDEVKLLRFPDHYYFSLNDLEKMQDGLSQLSSGYKMIVTTEKDAVRLRLHQDRIAAMGLPLYVIPLRIAFLFNEGELFNQYIFDYINNARSAQFNY